MSEQIGAGRLNKAVQVLELQETAPGAWEWGQFVGHGPCSPSRQRKTCFPRWELGPRRGVVLRRQDLTLHNALLRGEQHLFLSAILPEGRLHLRVQAALVEPVTCLATRTEDTVGEAGRPTTAETMRMTFPGVLTEKYPL